MPLFLKITLYCRILLKFDTKEFLNVLAMAFGDDKFSPQLKQRIVDILILVISQSTTFKVRIKMLLIREYLLSRVLSSLIV